MDTISEIYCLCTIDPVDDHCCSICDILYDNRYECADDDATHEEYDNIYPYECHPWWYLVLFSYLYERIHHHRDESGYHEYEYDRGYRPEGIESCDYREEDEDFFDPEREFVRHGLDMLDWVYSIYFSPKSKSNPMRKVCLWESPWAPRFIRLCALRGIWDWGVSIFLWFLGVFLELLYQSCWIHRA